MAFECKLDAGVAEGCGCLGVLLLREGLLVIFSLAGHGFSLEARVAAEECRVCRFAEGSVGSAVLLDRLEGAFVCLLAEAGAASAALAAEAAAALALATDVCRGSRGCWGCIDPPPAAGARYSDYFTCFTGTNLQILVQKHKYLPHHRTENLHRSERQASPMKGLEISFPTSPAAYVSIRQHASA